MWTIEVNVHLYLHDARGEKVTPPDDPTDGVDSVLRRYEKYNRRSKARQVDEFLVGRSWYPSMPKKGDYIRYSYAGSQCRAVLYLHSGNISVEQRETRVLATDWPGAVVQKSGTYFYFDDKESLPVFGAVKALEGWANGGHSASSA